MTRKNVVYVALGLGVAGAIVAGFLGWREPALRPDAILAAFDESCEYPGLVIRYPFDDAVFPPEIVPPTFQWEDATSGADAWLVTIQFPDALEPMRFAAHTTEWTPREAAWDAIKRRSLEGKAKVTILGVARARQDAILSAGRVTIGTSRDEVAAALFYREVNLPFIEAVKDPSRIRWRFGTISSAAPPRIVLEQLPVCGNCHSFSADASILGMDVDYANDKGSYAILPVGKEMVLDAGKIITWSDYRREDREPTFGLLSQVSPDGRYVVSTVKDESVFVPTEDLAFSQLFFPIKGILAVYDRQSGTFEALPGADDPQFVQSNPSWSPDGKHLVFARSKVHRLKTARQRTTVLLSPEECSEFLKEGKTFLFDLYRIAFNGGKGGKPEPVAGASHNGMSNYFARYSPDGKWIVFCRARSFMLLQPDSELFIIPAQGGEAQRLRANLGRMNSWHSWSPNGRWLVFSSKALSDYTQLFLAHVDADGQSSPPVLLAQFTAPDRAANIPEFVRAKPGQIEKIQERFLDEYNYVRVAQNNILAGDFQQAEQACRKALSLNPQSADALCNLGIAQEPQGMVEEARASFTKAIESNPDHAMSHLNLGHLLSRQGNLPRSLAHYREALRIDPDLVDAHLALGVNLVELNKVAEAMEPLAAAVRLRPDDATARYYLGLACHRQAKLDQALLHYAIAIQQKPDFVRALLGSAAIRATAKEPELRDLAGAVQLAERACELSEYQDAESLAILATAYARAGRPAEAKVAARRAIDLARKSGNAALAGAIQKTLGTSRQPPRP